MNKQTSVLHYQKAAAPLSGIAASPFKAPFTIGRVSDFADAEVYLRLSAKYPEFANLPPHEQRTYLAKRRSDADREVAQCDKELKLLRTEEERLRRISDAVGDLAIWSAESGLKIERPEGPSFRKLRKAVAEGRAVYMGKNPMAGVASVDFEKEVFRHAEVLVIEHDWAAAFKGANTEDASIRLPFDVCAFEFKFAGRPVIAFAVQAETEIVFCPAVLCGDVWTIGDFVVPLNYDPFDDRLSCMIELVDALADQIKAACIALDAEVAQTDTVREPHSGSAGHGTTQPLKPHHIVSLARRRAGMPALGLSDGSGKRKRLHFRRGHWRHFEDHKTWIKWMLVGDPDLGFVEKEYRL